MRELTIIQAIREALVEEMQKDEKVFIIGESVRGGVYEHTLGLVEEFGLERVLDTPLAETALVGAGMGSAAMGYRPFVDLMFADFMYVAFAEILLQTAQCSFLQGGRVNMPLVYFAATGGYGMLANEHSRVPSAMILHHPGLKLVMPSNPYDAKGLLKTAIRDNSPVVYFWHKMMMGETGEVPEGEYTVPFGVAEIKKEGSDVTVVASSMMVKFALEVAEELEGKISVEVIDPRTLEPLDLGTILKSLEKTEHLVVVDEDTERCGFGAELSAQIMEKGFDLLNAPVRRVCAANYPIPGGCFEKDVLPSPEKIKAAIEEIVSV